MAPEARGTDDDMFYALMSHTSIECLQFIHLNGYLIPNQIILSKCYKRDSNTNEIDYLNTNSRQLDECLKYLKINNYIILEDIPTNVRNKYR